MRWYSGCVIIIPVVFAMFLYWLLEDSNYIARTAFIMDGSCVSLACRVGFFPYDRLRLFGAGSYAARTLEKKRTNRWYL